MSEGARHEALRWEQLSPARRQALAGKIEGLYGQTDAPEAFNRLETDKQQALLLLLKRFHQLDLWPHVRSIGNVFGVGGVGMNFTAWPSFLEALRWHPEFTRRLAKRRSSDGGFREKRVRQCGLHILYTDKETERNWDAHFDRYNPIFSPVNTARHIWNEVLNSRAPDWREVKEYLRKR
jgi:hypothetical protein